MSPDPFGPYRSELDALAEPMPREVTALHGAGRVRSGDPDRLVRDTVLRHLLAACEAAGVEVGAFDRRILDWLAGWETSTCQVLIGLISRAHAGGLAAMADQLEAEADRLRAEYDATPPGGREPAGEAEQYRAGLLRAVHALRGTAVFTVADGAQERARQQIDDGPEVDR